MFAFTEVPFGQLAGKQDTGSVAGNVSSITQNHTHVNTCAAKLTKLSMPERVRHVDSKAG
jgi:hypothetical protein